MAIEEFDEAIDLDLNYAGAYDGRGYAYRLLGQYQNAINDYTMAVQLDSDYANAWLYNERGYAYSQVGQYQNAINDYTMAVQLDSDYATAWLYNERGVSYYRLDQYQTAVNDYTMAIQLEPSGLHYFNRAWAYYYLGEYTKMYADDAAACSLDSQYCSD